MSLTPVTTIRCHTYNERSLHTALIHQWDLLGGLNHWIQRGDRVLIKPNLIAPKPRHCPAQTHPAVILETARLLLDLGAKPFVGDSPAWGTVQSCIEALELTSDLDYLGVPLVALDHPLPCRINERTTVGISRVVLEADAVVNLPKLKAHQQIVATMAIKNMFGCVSGKMKPYWHFARGHSVDEFADFLLDVYRHIPITLTCIDGIVAMQGRGPINGETHELGWLIAGPDAVACERVAAHLIGLDPSDAPLLRAAQRRQVGISDLEQINLLGDTIEKTPLPFTIPPQIPIRFSLPRVIKSMAKGLFIGSKRKKTA